MLFTMPNGNSGAIRMALHPKRCFEIPDDDVANGRWIEVWDGHTHVKASMNFTILSPTDCEWNAWTSWSDCSATCDGGKRSRTRFAISPTRWTFSLWQGTFIKEVCEDIKMTSGGCNNHKCFDKLLDTQVPPHSKSTMSTVSSTTTAAATVPTIGMEATIAGLNFNALQNKSALAKQVKVAARAKFADMCGVAEHSVDVTLRQGSVIISADIRTNPVNAASVLARATQTALEGPTGHFASKLFIAIMDIPHITTVWIPGQALSIISIHHKDAAIDAANDAAVAVGKPVVV